MAHLHVHCYGQALVAAYEMLHRPIQAQRAHWFDKQCSQQRYQGVSWPQNKSLKRVSDDLKPVYYVAVPAIFKIPDQYIISPETVLAKLERIKVHKAPGPDGYPTGYCATMHRGCANLCVRVRSLTPVSVKPKCRFCGKRPTFCWWRKPIRLCPLSLTFDLFPWHPLSAKCLNQSSDHGFLNW